MTASADRAEAVLAVLKGASSESVAAGLEVEPELVERWVELFIEGGRLRLAGRLDPSSFEARDRFLVLIAHEFRTPLTTIGGWVETMLSDELTPELRQQGMEVILKQVAHLERIASDALDAGAVARGQLRLVVGPVRLRSLICAIAASARDGNVKVDEGAEVEIVADGARMEQVIGDVVAHAVRLAAGGPVVATIDGSHPARVTVTVSVAGRSLSYQEASELFEPYRRSDTSVGTGLGLFLSRALLAAHGGEIGLRSGNQGTEFWFRVPRSGPDPGPLVDTT
ncbi:hypothetical protein K6U06_15660 [Acidiferrimicrobium sp. IK]|uniref:sensor histidine kinase n=1 Tax=Acidiferrimicrobium sp. IK TaxID=2871700 RepID=UPI0021CB087E|nr:HAMP domain-containing sensor histidine kinase [Acidiferrimicrobium sp. IK]MCU4185805.1 hypothetical protein [Acidiferrimicrobium sp. IK]